MEDVYLHVCLSLQTSIILSNISPYICIYVPKKWQSDPPSFHNSLFGYRLNTMSRGAFPSKVSLKKVSVAFVCIYCCLRPGKILKIRPLKMLSNAFPPNHLSYLLCIYFEAPKILVKTVSLQKLTRSWMVKQDL